jgi:transposase
MEKKTSSINTDFIISFFLPDGMIDWFEIVKITEEPNTGTAQADVLYSSVLNIYLDERDNRTEEEFGLKPNGFTEPTVVKDYPIRNRKVLLHVRRRRYVDADGRNIILNQYPLTADGTKVSVEFGLFFKDGDGQASIDSNVIGKILSY